MLGVSLSDLRRVMFVGAHADDIEIGCGATVLRLLEENPSLEVTWVVLSAEGERRDEAFASARALLPEAVSPRVVVERFRTSYFPWQGEALKDYFETLKAHAPELVLTHARGDLHQDHRTVSELTWNTFRDHLVLEYEIPKYDADLGTPSFFIPVAREHVDRKTRLLLEHFRSQTTKHWFTAEVFQALPRLRGLECASPTQYAEAFHVRKLVLAPDHARRGARREQEIR